MKSGKLTNALLALIFLALLANVVVPLLRTNEASAAGSDGVAPSSIAASAGLPAVDRIASEVSSGLKDIARSNRQIADAIKENARSSEHIAESLQNVATGIGGIELKVSVPRSAHTPSRRAPAEEMEETDPNWWKGYIEE